MLPQEGCQLGEETLKAVLATKGDVYRQILRYLRIEGYPMESLNFSSVGDFVRVGVMQPDYE